MGQSRGGPLPDLPATARGALLGPDPAAGGPSAATALRLPRLPAAKTQVQGEGGAQGGIQGGGGG